MSAVDTTLPIERREVSLGEIAKLGHQLNSTIDPAEIKEIEARLDGIERYAREAGLYNTEQIRPINEMRMRARWKLGRVLAAVERGAGPGRGQKEGGSRPSFRKLLQEIDLAETAAKEAQRIGALPEDELEAALAEARKADILNTFADLIARARPYWYQARRQAKHRKIAREVAAPEVLGETSTFPLLYVDPPWKFEVYSDKGAERTPDRHYPTLSDHEIIHFKIDGRSVADVAHRRAALFLWCTSSNVHRALAVLEAWGFDFKTSAVWVKDLVGLGLVFRNRHELLLYGTRGDMPAPQWKPPSVFAYPRGGHSAKPPEIRQAIEKMYPDFGAGSRLELFARGDIPGWTCRGLEAGRAADERGS